MFLTSNELLKPILLKAVYHFQLFSYFDGVLTKRLGAKKYLCVESVCECVVIFVF